MNKNTLELLENLIKDSDEYNNLSVPDSEPERKSLIRSLMNVRLPKKIPAALIKIQDEYLKKELSEKGVVRLCDIPSAKEEFGCKAPFSDIMSVWQGDITRLEVDAIVNAANSALLGCFVPGHHCIDNAIHSFAGIQLREECAQIMRKRCSCYGSGYEEPTGTATLTDAYNLPCRHVIHTVGPIVSGRLSDCHRKGLRKCYKSVLECCRDNSLKSVAFCCISTGVFHFPNKEAAEIAVDTVTEFLADNPSFTPDRIIFNVFKDEDLRIYKRLFSESYRLREKHKKCGFLAIKS